MISNIDFHIFNQIYYFFELDSMGSVSMFSWMENDTKESLEVWINKEFQLLKQILFLKTSDGAKHGNGTYKYVNGNEYRGEWKGDRKNGHGVYDYYST